MATDLEVYGPFKVPFERKGNVKRVSRQDGRDFWNQPQVSALAAKQGCYVFAMQAAKGFKPWYVGKASKGFQEETFTDHKLGHYNDVLYRGSKGTPVLFFVAPPDKKRKVSSRELNHMEKELIQFALHRNPQICNSKHTKNLPKWTINGVVRSGPGRPKQAARDFKTMLRI